ncbi:MAG: hypothetical protein [Bacteriophage sp.]|nr:MAG: hypothetical protein [Bacteriophage sp.]
MTITLNSDYDVTLSTALLGYVGETNARHVSVEGMEVDGADRYVLTIDYGDGVQYEVDITGGQWTPTADILRSAQTVSCQIAAKKLSGDEYILVKKSRIFRLRIGAAIGDNAVPSPDVSMDALDRIDAIGRQAHADMQTAVTAAETATTAAENAKKSATAAGVSADTAEQAAERAETAQAAAETSATQADTAMQGAETARQQAVTAQNAAKVSAAQASTAAQQTEADKTITAGYVKTAKTCADSTAADRQAVQTLATQVTADKANVAENTAKVAEDRTAAETAAQTAQAVADSLPDDYVTAVGKIAENTAEIANVKLTDKELQRRVDALYSIGQGITHQFETDTDTAYAKTIPTGAKLMSVKSIGGHSEVIDGEIVSAGTESVVEQGKNLWNLESYTASDLVDLKTGYWGVKLSVKPNSTYCISVTRDTALCGTYGKLIGADKREIKFFGHKTMSDINAYTGHPVAFQTADEDYVYVAINSFNGFDTWKSDLLKYFPSFQIEKSSTATAYAPYHSNVYQIPEAIKALPGYGIEGNVTDYEAKTYTQNNTVDGTEIKALDTPIVTDISTLIDDDFLRNIEVESGGSVTFKNSNDSYRIPVPSEEEYIVKLSEIGGTT